MPFSVDHFNNLAFRSAIKLLDADDVDVDEDGFPILLTRDDFEKGKLSNMIGLDSPRFSMFVIMKTLKRAQNHIEKVSLPGIPIAKADFISRLALFQRFESKNFFFM